MKVVVASPVMQHYVRSVVLGIAWLKTVEKKTHSDGQTEPDRWQDVLIFRQYDITKSSVFVSCYIKVLFKRHPNDSKSSLFVIQTCMLISPIKFQVS